MYVHINPPQNIAETFNEKAKEYSILAEKLLPVAKLKMMKIRTSLVSLITNGDVTSKENIAYVHFPLKGKISKYEREEEGRKFRYLLQKDNDTFTFLLEVQAIMDVMELLLGQEVVDKLRLYHIFSIRGGLEIFSLSHKLYACNVPSKDKHKLFVKFLLKRNGEEYVINTIFALSVVDFVQDEKICKALKIEPKFASIDRFSEE